MYVLSNKEIDAAYTNIELAYARKLRAHQGPVSNKETHKEVNIIPILIYPYLATQYKYNYSQLKHNLLSHLTLISNREIHEDVYKYFHFNWSCMCAWK